MGNMKINGKFSLCAKLPYFHVQMVVFIGNMIFFTMKTIGIGGSLFSD